MTEGQMESGEIDSVESEDREREENGDSGYKKHLDREWDLLGWAREHKGEPKSGDDPSMVYDDVVELLEVFSRQGHSGSSALYVMRMFKDAAMFKPLSPLNGESNEWNMISEKTGEVLFQNRRRASVFMLKTWGETDPEWVTLCYDNEAVVYEDPKGFRFHGGRGTASLSDLLPLHPQDANDLRRCRSRSHPAYKGRRYRPAERRTQAAGRRMGRAEPCTARMAWDLVRGSRGAGQRVQRKILASWNYG